MKYALIFSLFCTSVFAAEHMPESFEFSGTDLDYKVQPLSPDVPSESTTLLLDFSGTELDCKIPQHFSLQVPGQTPVGIFGSGPASCGVPVATNLKAWYSADCMTAISPCATSFSNNQILGVGTTWLDRSVNSNTLTFDNVLSGTNCQYKTNQINGLPSISFNVDSALNCAWRPSSVWDSGATSWAIFIVFQDAGSATDGIFIGPFLTGAPNGSLLYDANDLNTTRRQQAIVKSGVAVVLDGTAVQNISWNQLNMYFSNSADQNTAVLRKNRAADGSSTPGVTITAGGAAIFGADKVNGVYAAALAGRVAELIIYSGTGAILSGADFTTNETYLNCRYGL